MDVNGIEFSRSVFLKSSFIDQVGFNEVDNKMFIQFNDGKRTLFQDVEEATYRGLISAMSPGTFFWENIANKYKEIT